MAGNPKTPKSTAPSWAQTKPGSKGVMVGKNSKATLGKSGGKYATESSAVVGKKKK
jgi:hypothetical protein